MIVQEIFEENPDLIRTYSDSGFKIRQIDTGYIYDEAIDIASTTHTYEETDEPIEKDEPYTEHEAENRLNILLGQEE